MIVGFIFKSGGGRSLEYDRRLQYLFFVFFFALSIGLFMLVISVFLVKLNRYDCPKS